jgi:small-conductance mechanosensitive channel
VGAAAAKGLSLADKRIAGLARLFQSRPSSLLGRGRTVKKFVLAVVIVIVLALAAVAVWLGAGREVAAAFGWIAAGLTIALQRVVTAAAGYLIIKVGRIFRLGDRITIGGVRGDVAAIGLMQTTVMEMGQSPGEQGDDPSLWVQARQYTGRIVRITNDKVFDSPVYNYTREFPYLWEEIVIPVRYGDPRDRVESILLDVARRHTNEIVEEARPRLQQLCSIYHIPKAPGIDPVVYLRLTDNWVELTVRFLIRAREARSIKDQMSRDVIDALDQAKIGIASGTYAIVEMPTLNVQQVSPS